jgi:hydroxymethylglutaryl-CoA lyase
MGFGNPYGDPYSAAIIHQYIERLDALEIRNISIADTIGSATPQLMDDVLSKVLFKYPHIEMGVHMHASPQHTPDLIAAALDAGVRSIDTSINGVGGCPFAKDELVGNVDTAIVLEVIQKKGFHTTINKDAFEHAQHLAAKMYLNYK